jgi:hypothetical protein
MRSRPFFFWESDPSVVGLHARSQDREGEAQFVDQSRQVARRRGLGNDNFTAFADRFLACGSREERASVMRCEREFALNAASQGMVSGLGKRG